MHYCLFALNVTAAMLVVKNKTDFSPLGTKLYFRVNSSRKKLYCNTLVNTFLIYSVLSGRNNLPFSLCVLCVWLAVRT